MAKPKGYLSLTSPEGMREFNTLSCVHCQRVIVVKPHETPTSGYCGNCAGVICAQCSAVGRCTPFEKWLDRVEKKAYRDSQLSMLGIK